MEILTLKKELIQRYEELNLTHEGKSEDELKILLLDYFSGRVRERWLIMSSPKPLRSEMSPQEIELGNEIEGSRVG